jgi:hypothetical protein
MGLTGAAVGLNSSIQDMLLARLQERQYQDKLRQRDFDNQMREKQFQSNEQLKHAQLDATVRSPPARRGRMPTTHRTREHARRSDSGRRVPP